MRITKENNGAMGKFKYSQLFTILMFTCALVSCNSDRCDKHEKGAGNAYKDSCLAVILAAGAAYEDGKKTGEEADIYLPPGEHPLDDENLDDWNGTLGA